MWGIPHLNSAPQRVPEAASDSASNEQSESTVALALTSSSTVSESTTHVPQLLLCKHLLKNKYCC